jgi:hypothetical protein
VDQADQQLAEVEADRLGGLEGHVDGHQGVRVLGRHQQVLGAGVAVGQGLGQAVHAVEQLGQARPQGAQVGPEAAVDGPGDQRVGPDLVPLEQGQPGQLDPRAAVVAEPRPGRQRGGGQQGRVGAPGGEPAGGPGGPGEPGPGPVQGPHVLHPHGQAVVAQLGQPVQAGHPQAGREPVGEPRLPGDQLPAPGDLVEEAWRTASGTWPIRGQCRGWTTRPTSPG